LKHKLLLLFVKPEFQHISEVKESVSIGSASMNLIFVSFYTEWP